MAKAVIFDCFGVLYGGSLFTLLNMCPPEKRQQLIDTGKQNDHGYMTTRQYAEAVAELIGKTPEEVVEIFKQKRVRNQPLFDLIRSIKSPQVKIGMITNAGRDLPGELFTDEEIHGGLFDVIVVSSAVGVTKPGPDIYLMAAEKLGVDTSDCLFVDDMFENCNGAEAVNMHAVWFADNITVEQHVREFIQNA